MTVFCQFKTDNPKSARALTVDMVSSDKRDFFSRASI